jgi:hypothetical protein
VLFRRNFPRRTQHGGLQPARARRAKLDCGRGIQRWKAVQSARDRPSATDWNSSPIETQTVLGYKGEATGFPVPLHPDRPAPIPISATGILFATALANSLPPPACCPADAS